MDERLPRNRVELVKELAQKGITDLATLLPFADRYVLERERAVATTDRGPLIPKIPHEAIYIPENRPDDFDMLVLTILHNDQKSGLFALDRCMQFADDTAQFKAEYIPPSLANLTPDSDRRELRRALAGNFSAAEMDELATSLDPTGILKDRLTEERSIELRAMTLVDWMQRTTGTLDQLIATITSKSSEK